MGAGKMRALLCDTRQKPGKHDAKEGAWESMGVPTVRSKLPFGDYAMCPGAAVDTKRDIYELASDIDQQHDRFRRELAGARDAGCALTVLVENEDGVASLEDLASWEEPDGHYMMRRKKSGNPNAKRISGRRLAKACLTMEGRYGARFSFCAPGEAAGAVLEILEKGEKEQ